MRLDWLWFLGYDIDSEVPDHSVLSKARVWCYYVCTYFQPELKNEFHPLKLPIKIGNS